MIEHIHHVAITVRNLQETLDFYAKIGFQVISRNEFPNMEIAFIQANEAKLEVFCPKTITEPPELKNTDLGKSILRY